MKYNLFCLLLILLLLSACTKPHKDGTFFAESKKLLAEKIRVNEMFSPDFVTKSGENFIISNSKSDTTLFFYETPSLKFKFATGMKGKGPDEIQTFPMFCHTLNDKYLYIRGYSPMSIKKISLESDNDLLFVDEYNLGKYDEYNFMNIINDSLFIYYSSNKLTITKYDLKNEVVLDKIEFRKDDHNESYFYSNRGFIAANDSFVVYPYIYKKQMNIYSVNDFKLVKKIVMESIILKFH